MWSQKFLGSFLYVAHLYMPHKAKKKKSHASVMYRCATWRNDPRRFWLYMQWFFFMLKTKINGRSKNKTLWFYQPNHCPLTVPPPCFHVSTRIFTFRFEFYTFWLAFSHSKLRSHVPTRIFTSWLMKFAIKFIQT